MFKKNSLKPYQQKLERFHTNKPMSKEIREFEALTTGIKSIESRLNLKPFDEQILGAFTLSDNKIAEMKTGEGKTITAALSAIMTAHTGQVMIITVNDYLATRDFDQLKAVYEDCGYSVGLVTHAQTPYKKKQAYKADIVYVTNSELGFDILRDNTAKSLDMRVISKDFNRAIIDEVDSVLIDSARTPLILSSTGTQDISKMLYMQINNIVRELKPEYIDINKKSRTVTLTENGQAFVENKLVCGDLYSENNVLYMHLVSNALKAHFIERENVEYLIKRGKIELIDQMGGRVMDGRRYNDGLMQALEAKERLEINAESKTLASITYQNMARLFKNLSGMTGTATSEAKEFKQIYNLDIIQIPTHKPMIRKDHPDTIFKTQHDAHMELVRLVKHVQSTGGRPLLIAADSTRRAEQISKLFTNENIIHTLLTAKDASKEAQVIREAGRTNSILITTSLAGRGTDIKLQDENAQSQGLFVVGVGRGQSKRVDDQLRGRSGRQGDPGTSVFYVTPEDDLYNILDNPERTRSGEIKWSLYTPDYTQKMIEAKDYDSRKQTLEYDDVLREQRSVVYAMRDEILNSDPNTDVEKEFNKIAENLPNIPSDIKLPTLKQFNSIKLQVLDNLWSDYMANLDYVKDTMVYRSYAGRNPLIDFQKEAHEMFDMFITNVRKEIGLNILASSQPTKQTKPKRPLKNSTMRKFVKTK